MATVRDLLISATTGDLVITGGQLELVSDLAAISQSIRTRLRFFLGEWFADESIGVPWFQSILVKAPNLGAIRSTLRNEILATRGVASVTTFDFTFDGATRTLSVRFSAVADTGELITFDEAFTPTPEVT